MIRRPVVVLDVDGVLKPNRPLGEDGGLDPACVQRVVDIRRQTVCVFALSSAWRIFGYGVRSVYGQCLSAVPNGHIVRCATVAALPLEPTGHPIPRDELIARFVAEHQIERWVVLDDDPAIERLPAGHWVRTEGAVGVTDANVNRVVELLQAHEHPAVERYE